ncbi:MAG TPA: DUF6174 domain-containing protein [Gemmatimonadaceae bacterium]|nr:DUF6174 domain-containing protein [Gemmatimonadaceae bacterium]
MSTARSRHGLQLDRSARRRLLPRVLSLLLVTASLSACAIITGPDDEWDREQRDLSRARRLWSAQRIDDYEFVVRRECFCPMGGVAVRVQVRNYLVVSREIDLTGVAVPSSLAHQYPSIDGLFGLIQGAIDDRAYEITTRYDSSYGFPTDVYIDYDRRVVDEEEGYVLLRFRELP